jgi:hypothetical protein
MALPRALIEMAVEGAAESQRQIDSIADALRRMNGESLDRISGQMNSLGERYSNLQSTIGNVAGFAIAGVSLASLAARITDTMDSMAELDDLSQKIGTSVERLSQIQKVAKAFGADFAGSVDPALTKLARGLTTFDEKSSKTGKALAALGISANALSDPGEIMIKVAKSLQQYENGSAKAALVNDLFGKSAADLLPFLNDLAETVDGFSTISAKSVDQVASLQDQFGMLGVRADEAFEAVTTAALPALSALANGFADALQKQDGLIDSGEIADWARMAAMGIARVADVALLAVRSFSAISSSVQVVAADLKVLWTASPARMAYSAANGGSPLEELKKTVAERNQILEDANKKWSDFVNARADVFSSRVAGFLAAGPGAAPEDPAAVRGTEPLAYKSGGDDADKNAEKLANSYQNLVKAIQAKIAQANLELSAGEPLAASQQEQLKLTEQLAEMKGKLTPIQYALLESEGKELVTKLEVIESNKRAAEGLASYTKSMVAYETSVAKSIENALTEAVRNEELALTYGMTKSAVEALELARLEEQLAQRSTLGLTLDEIETLEKLISAKKRNAVAVNAMEQVDAAKKAAEEWKRTSESIEQSLTDALLRGFESGDGFGRNFVETLKNMFNTLVLRPVISAIVNPVAGAVTGALGLAGTAQAATGGGVGVGGVVSGLGTLGSLSSGVGLLGAGGLGLQAGFGALMSSGFAGIGAAVSGGIAAIGAGTGASIAAGMGTIAGALGPIALGIGAAVAIWKKFDTSGTKHTGGAATSSSAGTSAIKAQSLNMADIATSVESQKMVEGLTQGIVGILDSTALAFGKTAGYTAATAFADDTSKDGAWGSLMIQKLGQTVVNWQDTRGGTKWAPKTFADGEKGQEQYLTALTSSVRGALNSIGLPDWARTMLDGVASNASLENLAQVVEQINVTQVALGAMRSQLIGFSSMSDSAVSALMAAAGGIDKLFGNASAYYDAFYTEAEKNAVVTEQVAKSLAAVNLQMPATKEGYRALLEAQMKLGPAGAESVAVLFASAAAFAQVTAEAQIATDKNAELEASMADARSALTDAYKAESDAISATTDRMGSFAASLKSVRENALLGELSPLSPQEKYVEAKAQYESVLAAARGGDESAQSNYSAAFNSFLTASRAVFASSAQYQADFAYAQASTAETERWASAQVDVGKAQLDALKLSVSGLITLDKSVLSVRDAILQMHQVMGTTAPPAPGAMAAPQINMPTPVMYASYGTDSSVALVSEIKRLNGLVEKLTAEQKAQTGDIITANARAASDNADRVAGATTTAVKSVANSEQRVAFA